MTNHLSTTYRKQVTWNGFGADIMKSGLQKYIRRGITDKALYCAAELDLFKEAPHAKEGEGIRTNFLHRLMIIFMEDVENLSLFDEIYAKIKQLFNEREKEDRSKEKEQRWIHEVVIRMSQSTKARVCSHIRAIFNPNYKPIHDRYPTMKVLWAEIEKNEEKSEDKLEHDCTLFKKYLKEKHILAVYYAFQIELSSQKLKEKLFRSAQPVWFIFQQLIHPLSLVKTERVKKFMEWYKDHIGGMKEGFMCWLLPLLYELDVIPLGDLPLDLDVPLVDTRNADEIKIDDYVLDKHTRKGQGKGLVDFALYGSLVSPQAAFVHPLWKNFYEDGKRWEEGVAILGESPSSHAAPSSHESLAYTFLVRTQLTTMGTKMDVYFAKDASEKLVVVKGPYATHQGIDILQSITEWKKEHGLPYNSFQIQKWIPDRWPEGVPLGARNKVNRQTPAFFLVFDSYLKESEIRTMMHSSTVWPATEVVDWSNISFHFTHKARPLTDQEYIDYVHALLFRYLLGISDFADRNFLMKEGRVISIDEDVENREIDLYATLKKNKAEFIHQWIRDHYHLLQISSWKVKDKENAVQQRKLKEIQNKDQCIALFTAR